MYWLHGGKLGKSEIREPEESEGEFVSLTLHTASFSQVGGPFIFTVIFGCTYIL